MHEENYEPVPEEYERAARATVDAALTVHRTLGPGLLESLYQSCLAHELRKRRARVQTEVDVPVVYDGVRLDTAYRIDLLVSGCLLVELKAVEEVTELHKAQVLTCLKVTGHRLALLVNFNVPLLKQGIRRIVL